MKRILALASASAVAAGAAGVVVPPAEGVLAYALLGGGCHWAASAISRSFYDATTSTYSYWWDGALYGAMRWNNETHDGPNLSQTSTASSTNVAIKTFYAVGAETGRFNEDRSNHSTPPDCTGTVWSNPTIWLNGSVGQSWTANKRRTVGAHEFGHGFGLNDLPQSGCDTKVNGLMQGGIYVYDNCGWNGPQSDDIAGVNAIYT